MAKKKKGLDPNIRKMVCANHGGFENADDTTIQALWNRLDEPTKNRYAEQTKADSLDGEPKSKRSKDADSS